MKPILFTIPQIPAGLLPIIAALLVVGALAWLGIGYSLAKKAGTAPDFLSPLVVCGVLAGVAILLSRVSIPVHSYGLFVVTGYFVGIWLAVLEARRKEVDPNIFLDMALPFLFVTVIMCRVLYIALDPGQFHSFGDMLKVWSGGLSFHGAIIGAFMVVGYYAYTRRVSLLTLGDTLAPGVFLGYAIGRLGCFFNGCCYGGVCDLPWAVQFPDELHRGQLTPPSHPAQLYSSLLALACFAFMRRAKLMPQFNRFAGQMMLMFLALYAVERGIVEIFRNGTTATTVLGTTWMTQAQLTSVIGLVAVAITWGFLARRVQHPTLKPQDPAPTPPDAGATHVPVG